MFRRLVSHNDDLARLVAKGYAVGFDGSYLIIRDVPYLDSALRLRLGAIVSTLVFEDQDHVLQQDHQIYFAGDIPYGLDGKPIPNMGGGPVTIQLSAAASDIVIQRRFSNKPKDNGRFIDFFAKIEAYVAIISGPAMARHDVTPLTFRSVEEVAVDSAFKIYDTLTTRAEIADLTATLREDVIAIIGLGGTGGYLLDFLVKTPVREIRGFDRDPFLVHNAHRSPGRLSPDEFRRPKAEVYTGRYENFRFGLSLKPMYIDENSADELNGVTFAFVCVDDGPSRASIFGLLIRLGIPFIDVGMGLRRQHGPISGMLRTTYYAPDLAEERLEQKLAVLEDAPDDAYSADIQISELNALNASIAVLKYKQLRGFYEDAGRDYHLLFDIRDMRAVGMGNDD